MQKPAISEKGLLLDVDVSADIPHVLVGDQLRVKQILLNLLGNAIKFTSKGGIVVSARLIEHHESSVIIQLTVRDSGVGISAGSLDDIFKAFVQEDGSTTRKFGGTGLGLTISRRLTELLGGSISVESTQGVGSSFTVTLPFSTIQKIGIESVKHIDVEALDGWNGPALRILFVEDNQINMTFGVSLLKKMGHDVRAVNNGSECLDALQRGSYDLVLMDIQMPVMNGEEAVLEIRRREQETGLHLPVIAQTAYALRGEKERFLEAGFDGYIAKPLVIEELIQEMKRVINGASEPYEHTRRNTA